jgi:CRISPR system Cascade subunit CasA
MKPHFNLVDEPWIPCLLPDHRAKEFGLREVLARAHEVKEIFHSLPLVVTALHRLLLAILHRNSGPETPDDWKVLWHRGWDVGKLERYFTKWRDRFYLFHPERPFYQVAKMPDAVVHPVQKLAEEASWGNNPTLFDHHYRDRIVPFHPAQAAQYLVACHGFALAGLAGPKHGNFSDAPLARGYTVMVLGKTLFETLALNLQPVSWSGSDDQAAWERESPVRPDKRGAYPRGLADYLTWQSRRIHLISPDDAKVTHCQILPNLRLPEGFYYDPFKCYRKDKQGKMYLPLRIEPERSLWRDSHTLFEKASGDRATLRPEVFQWVAELRMGGALPENRDFHFSLTGLATERGTAKVLLWCQERLPLPLAYLDDKDLLDKLKDAIAVAEKTHETLRWGLRWVASLVLSPESGGQSRRPDRGEVDRLLKSWAPGRLYWPRLGAPFRRLLVELPDDQEDSGDGVIIFGNRKMPEWVRTVYQAAFATFREVAAGLERSVRSLKAVARVEGPFRARLHRELIKGGES